MNTILFLNSPKGSKVLIEVTAALRVAVFVYCLGLIGCSQPKQPEQLVSEAKRELRRSNFAQAEKLAEQVTKESSLYSAARLVAAEASAKDSRPEDAVGHYDAVIQSESSDKDVLLAAAFVADLHLSQSQFSRCEDRLLFLIRKQPGHSLANARLAFLYSFSGQQWQAAPFYQALIRGAAADYETLAIAADLERQVSVPEMLSIALKQQPGDPLVRCAAAASARYHGEPDAAVKIAEAAKSAPHRLGSQAMLGEHLVDGGEEHKFRQWYASLPDGRFAHPGINFVLGKWFQRQGERQLAEWCFRKAILAEPAHRRATYQLSQILNAVKSPDADVVQGRAEMLIELSQKVDRVLLSEGNDEATFQRVTELLVKLGRIWEGCAWSVEAKKMYPNPDWADDIINQHGDRLKPNLPFAILPACLRAERLIDRRALLDDYFESVDNDASSERIVKAGAYPSFESTTAIPFEYLTSHDPDTDGVRTFEQTGGGVLVLDIDNDAWPDVCFPQGVLWKTGSKTPTPDGSRYDAVYRNRFGKSFTDVSRQCLQKDDDYSQGGAVADIDNDGFDDLYIANVGRNRLMQNMGDGTFLDVSDEAQRSSDSWTVSALACDLNLDGQTDLLDVNYLQGEDVYTRICDGVACSPGEFEGAPDRLLINAGQWRFSDASQNLPTADSKGLGVVGFYQPGRTSPLVFIANDQVANFLLAAPTDTDGQFRNAALETGVAYNEEGLAMACMGVAVDDWNRDGLHDVFVTNFHDETNTVYLQDNFGMFSDATRYSGLADPSFAYTGWGTQSFDANLDGWPDLVVANGHVDDYSSEGGPFKMRPQFYQNTGGSFQEVSADELGPWFAGEYLGRSLAKLDWNRDGKIDFVVSPIHEQVAVLKNTTSTDGRFLNLKLHGVELTRNAFGCRALATFTDGTTIVQQLNAGGGYMAENERMIQFGVREGQQIQSVVVTWPAGSTTTIQRPPLSSHLTMVEGRNVAYVESGDGRLQTRPVATKVAP